MDTICAVSTPNGIGGISVLRVSGEGAFLLCDKIFKGNKKVVDTKGYTTIYGNVFDDDEFVDDVILNIFRSPKSYTGEDTVEISCHGSIAITQKILRLLIKNGGRLATGGEFTRRAFEKGKISLLDAEAVAETISAENENELKFANMLRTGVTFKKIVDIKNKILDICASLAVWADYPDDVDYEPKNLAADFKNISTEIKKLLSTYDYGRTLKNGINTAVIGKPNVGKSSLMNALIGYERSIVTEIAGTTRDIVQEKINIGGVTLNLADTAGIRQTDDKIEQIGVKLSQKTMETADLVLAVFDNSQPFSSQDTEIIKNLKNKKAIFVLNKSDLGDCLQLDGVRISAKNGDISQLCNKIIELFSNSEISQNTGIIANERQFQALNDAHSALLEAQSALKNNLTLDIISVLLDDACDALLTLLGEKITTSLADRVFEKFCVGK
jgi:tRNA modification GTPase